MTMEKTERFGTFSSSQIWKLMTNDRSGKGFGAPALKYLRQVQHEINLGRAINKETNARACSWGNICEQRVHEILPLEYSLVSTERLFHPDIPFYSGAPDLIKELTVCDCKAPFSLEVFCDKIEALQNVEVYKKEYPEDFYQHISNAILLEANGTKITHFEAVVYCPYQSELEAIRELARNWDDENQNQFAFVNWSGDNELPYLPNDCKAYKNLNIIKFEISEEDKQALTERVIAAGLLLKS